MKLNDKILIAGPTASGKSDLALQLAKDTNSVIINADSMQVYDKVKILTARPEENEFGNFEHYLFGVVAVSENFSTGKWLDLVKNTLQNCHARNQGAIFVGGTGLYFNALLQGLAEIPLINSQIIDEIEDRINSEGLLSLYDELAVNDKNSAMVIDENDSQRIIRALSVFKATGKTLSYWWSRQADEALISKDDCVRIALIPDRQLLYERINKRCDLMVEKGVIDEVKYLLSLVNNTMQNNEKSNIYKAIGVSEFKDYLDGEISLEEAVMEFKKNSRRYAKRQYTWIRRHMEGWYKIHSLEIDKQMDELRDMGLDV